MPGAVKITDNNQPDLIEALDGGGGSAPLPLETGDTWPDGKARGRGRPAGSLNRKTATLQKWLLAKGYRDPAVILAETYSMPVDDLAAILRCKRLEAFDLQRKAASDLLPYFHGRILPKTDEGEQPLPQLHLHLDVDQVALAGQKMIDQAPIQVAQKMAENCEISDADYEMSHDDSRGDSPSD